MMKGEWYWVAVFPLAAAFAAAPAGCSSAHADCVPVLAGVPLSGQNNMPLGDSITFGVSDDPGDNAYRAQLYTDIIGGSATVQFVGSQSGGTLLPVGERANEGHPGFQIADIAAGVDAWIAAQPGMTRVDLMIGINNIIHGTVNTFTSQYASLLDRIHTDCPSCVIYDMNMLPINNTGTQYTQVLLFNQEIKSVCYHRTFCRFVDVYSSVVWPTDFSADGVHPLNTGYNKVGNALYAAMVAYQSATLQGY